MLDAVRERFGLAAGAEVTVEANPESVTPPRSPRCAPAA